MIGDNFLDSRTPEQKLWTLAHEIATPIETIRGFAFIIKKDIESNKVNPEEILRDIKIISEAADKLHKLLEELRNSK